ncbi:MAG: helix-turn-helix domain-containing protein [Bacilli bacterium]
MKVMKSVSNIKSYLLCDNNLVDVLLIEKALSILLKHDVKLKKIDELIEVSELSYGDMATLSVSLNTLRIDHNLDYLSLIIVPLYNTFYLKDVKFKKTGVFFLHEVILATSKDEKNSIPYIIEMFNHIPKEILVTVKNYINCNHSLTFTGEYMFAHRNTINYRVNKFINYTSIDIRNIDNSMFVSVILNLMDI